MIIGVPRERKELETRVALLPEGARKLKALGATIRLERGAGINSGFPDDEYRKVGVELVGSLEEVWNGADLILKVKEPAPEEYPLFRPGLAIFSFLHLAGLPSVAKKLVESRMIGIAYEMVVGPQGGFPILTPMSEIAGKLAILNGSNALLAQHGGPGVLIGGAEEVTGAEVVVFGAGNAGRAACVDAARLGAHVTVLDASDRALALLERRLDNDSIPKERVTMVHGMEVDRVRDALSRSILVVSAVLVPGAEAPRLLRKEHLDLLPQNAVIVDVSIDQGGSVEGGSVTSLGNPTRRVGHITYFGIPNMPAQAGQTATRAICAASLPYVEKLAAGTVIEALMKHGELREAVMTYNGLLTSKPAAESLGMAWTELAL